MDTNLKSKEEIKYLRSIRAIGIYLHCCDATAQAIKNKLPHKLYVRYGRKFYISEEVLENFLKTKYKCKN